MKVEDKRNYVKANEIEMKLRPLSYYSLHLESSFSHFFKETLDGLLFTMTEKTSTKIIA